jgi:hypothetical protein
VRFSMPSMMRLTHISNDANKFVGSMIVIHGIEGLLFGLFR